MTTTATQPRMGIVIDLTDLRALMAEFIGEVATSDDDVLNYTIPFETFLQWLIKRDINKQKEQQ